MMKPNDFCVNDVKFCCVWGSRTTWESLNEIQKERKDKIVFSGTVEERGEGSRYAFFRDDEQGINYLIPIQESGQQDCGKLSVKMTEFLEEQVPAELCTIDRFGNADDFDGCGYCFDGAEANGKEMDCEKCVVNKIFHEYARVQKEQGERKQQTQESKIFESAVYWYGKEAQTDMMIEEMAELTKEILNERRGRDHNIAEEMADVKIMLAQMEIIFQNVREVERKFREKVARLDRRLQERRGGAAHE